jgi:cobalamin biosynthesis Mg chelatase CobN
MRTRTVLAAAVLAAVATVPVAGVASAQPAAADRDCRDFASQAAAQSALNSRSGDPLRLDADDDQFACEEHFAEPEQALGPPPDERDAVDAYAVETSPSRTRPSETPPSENPPSENPPSENPPSGPSPSGTGSATGEGRGREGRDAVDAPAVDRAGEPVVVDAPPVDAPVRTVPENQILVRPQGAPDTGDGSAASAPAARRIADDPVAPAVLLVGGLVALVLLCGFRAGASR